jgi:Phosphate-starvation-inducible E family
MAKTLPHILLEIRRDWAVLSAYERFDAFVSSSPLLSSSPGSSSLLSGASRTVSSILWCSAVSTRWSTGCFRRSLARLTVLIAPESNHTLQYAVTRERGIIQAKIVILIGVLALVRKIIVTDLSAAAPAALAAEAALILALGVTYWLMRERDDLLHLDRRMRRRGRAPEGAE